MKIHIDPHTLEHAEERGTTAEEIREVISSGVPIPAKQGRTEKAKVFPYQKLRGQRFYEQKRVEVIYITEQDAIITVIVYAFYGKWEDER